MALKFALVAGEASGDALGAGLIREIQRIHPDARFAGIAGPKMQAQGCQTWWPAESLAVMGLFEVLRHLPRLLRLRRELQQRIVDYRPDVFIGIDAPDFNLSLEQRLKLQGISTVHYVSPSIWAWRQGRVKSIAQAVDKILCLFPFEPAFYAGHGVAAEFIGHPMADEIELEIDAGQARQVLGLAADKTTIALLPGSRMGEVSRLAVPMLGAAQRLAAKQPLQFVAALANERTAAEFRLQAEAFSGINIHIASGQARAALAACDVAITASGTVTLEALLTGRPMVVCYRLNPATYQYVKTFNVVKSKYISLPNALADEALVPELIQAQASPESLASAVQLWLDQPQQVAALRQRFKAMHGELRQDASRKAAAAVLELVA